MSAEEGVAWIRAGRFTEYVSELARGFVTLPGGHRAGICGEAALDKSGSRTVRYISSVNLRVASEHIGCSREITAALFHDGLCGALIAGPPCSGKTTLLRDMARLLSSEPYGKKVAVVDERGEMAAMYRGEPRNRIGTFSERGRNWNGGAHFVAGYHCL